MTQPWATAALCQGHVLSPPRSSGAATEIWVKEGVLPFLSTKHHNQAKSRFGSSGYSFSTTINFFAFCSLNILFLGYKKLFLKNGTETLTLKSVDRLSAGAS